MLKNSPPTARLFYSLLLAVVFSSSGFAVDSSLCTLEVSLNNLIFVLSRSVVTVKTSERVSAAGLGGSSDEAYQTSIYSGIVCDTFGHILVKASAIQNKSRIEVSIGDQSILADIVAIDYQDELALLRTVSGFGRPVKFSDRHACAGQMVVAIGNSFGICSAPALGFCAGVRDDGTLQFSVSVQQGALGGGVFDLSGNLLGLIVGGIGNDNRVTLAYPAHDIKELVGSLLLDGDLESGYAGMTTQEIQVEPPFRIPHTSMLASAGTAQFNENYVERGVLVNTILPNSPALRAGLAVGDLIFAIDDMPVNSASGMARLVRQSQPDTKVVIELLRRGNYLALPMIIGTKRILLSGYNSSKRINSGDISLADSLRQSLEMLKKNIIIIEHRLNSLH